MEPVTTSVESNVAEPTTDRASFSRVGPRTDSPLDPIWTTPSTTRSESISNWPATCTSPCAIVDDAMDSVLPANRAPPIDTTSGNVAAACTDSVLSTCIGAYIYTESVQLVIPPQ